MRRVGLLAPSFRWTAATSPRTRGQRWEGEREPRKSRNTRKHEKEKNTLTAVGYAGSPFRVVAVFPWLTSDASSHARPANLACALSADAIDPALRRAARLVGST